MTEERRLAAILFSDVCGFSRTMGEDEPRAMAIIGMATSAIEDAVRQYGGRVIKKMGDGMLCEFSSAVNAVRAALAVQKAVAIHNETAPEPERFLMRIGIHVGDVVVSEGDIFGDGVNVASRIEPLAEPGGICISRDVLDLVKNKVVIETVLLGPRELKNINHQVDIFKVLIDAVGSPPSPVSRSMGQWVRSRKVWLPVLCVLVGVFGVVGVRLYRTGVERRHAQIQATKMTSEIQMAQEAVTARHTQFLKAVESNDREGALALIDPETLRVIDGTAIWIRARIAASLQKQKGGPSGNFRITDVALDSQRETAYVKMEVDRREPGEGEAKWEPVPPFEWRNLNGAWFLHLEAKRGGDGPAADRPPFPFRRPPGKGNR